MSEHVYVDKRYPRQAVTRFELDLSIEGVQRSITVTQGDTNRRMEVTFCDAGNPFEIPDKWRAALTGELPSGEPLYEAGIAKDGRVIVDFVGLVALTAEIGVYMIAFDLFDEEGEIVSSPKVWLTVVQGARRLPTEDSQTLQRLSLLQKFVEEANQIHADIKDLQDDVEQIDERIDGIAEEVDRNTENIEKNHEDITKLQRLTSTSGVIEIDPKEWDDQEQYTARILVNPEVLRNGSVMLIMPASEETKFAAEKARLTLNIDESGDREGDDVVMFARSESGIKPDVKMRFRYAVIHTENDTPATVTIVGGLGNGAGDNKVYIGPGPAPLDANVWINPEGDPAATEVWEFELESGDTETKSVVVLE